MFICFTVGRYNLLRDFFSCYYAIYLLSLFEQGSSFHSRQQRLKFIFATFADFDVVLQSFIVELQYTYIVY